jgi:hypothetical protein
MNILRRHVVLLFGVVAGCSPASAATYYIDFGNGQDTNIGTSINSPWKRHPYMTGWTGKYTHSAGDRFIFKGGIVWRKDCWKMTVLAGGALGNPDQYTVDKSWFLGSAWSRPIFDGENVLLPGNGHMVQVNASHVVFDNIEFRNLLSGSNAAAHFLAIDSASYITSSNCYFHGWDQISYRISSISRSASGQVTATTTTPTDFKSGARLIVHGVADASFNTDCGNHCGTWTDSITVVDATTFTYASSKLQSASSQAGIVTQTDSGSGVMNKGGPGSNNTLEYCTISNTEFSGTHNSGQAVNGISTIRHCSIHDVASVTSGVNYFHDNVVYNVGYPTAQYDANYHTNIVYQTYAGAIFNNLMYNLSANAAPLYPNPEGDRSTCTPNTVSIFNNVVRQGDGPPLGIVVDVNDYYGASPCDTVIIANNTFASAGDSNMVRIINRGAGLARLDFRNNHLINNSGTNYTCFNRTGCGSASTLVNNNNIWQSISAAAANGYDQSRNLAPSSAAAVTVRAGVDLSELCAGYLTAICSDTSGGGRKSPYLRQAPWDVGAYQFAVGLAPPTALSAIVVKQ